MIRVFIISPAIAVRAGLRSLLSDDPRIQVIGEASTITDSEERHAEADVLVWSPALSMEREALLLDMSNIKEPPGFGLLVLHNDPQLIEQLTGLPVRSWGLLAPEASQAEIIAAVEAVNEGLVVTNPAWLGQVRADQGISRDRNSTMIEALTERELETLQLMALGLTNKQIAVRLGISTHTVKFHISSIFSKMATTNRTETVKLGLKMGLILL